MPPPCEEPAPDRSTDAELLRRYAAGGDEAAFAEVVRRHIDLVYSVALRQVAGDEHLAQDVTQAVFAALARKAVGVAARQVLAGWLFRAAHFAASDAVRRERRRRAREQGAHTMHENPPSTEPTTDWDRVRPTLDAAIAELDERDRNAVALRFFDGCSFADVGARLSLTENAARMRVERALAKLHAALARRGVTSTTSALAVALAGQAGMAAPAGLAASVVATAGAAVASGGAAAALTLMSMIKIGIGGAVVAAGVVGLWWQHGDNARLTRELALLREQQAALASLSEENERLRASRNVAETRVSTLTAELAARDPARQVANAPVGEGASRPAGGGASVTETPKLAAGLKPATNAGKATPSSTAETVFWAITGGDVDALASCLSATPKAKALMAEMYAKLPAEKRGDFATPEHMLASILCSTTPAEGLQVVSERPGGPSADYDGGLAAGEDYRTLQVRLQTPGGRIREQELVFAQGPEGWRWIIAPGLVLKVSGAVSGGSQPATGGKR